MSCASALIYGIIIKIPFFSLNGAEKKRAGTAMKKMILLIINPRSGRNKINDDLLEATNVFGMHGYGITVLNTTKAVTQRSMRVNSEKNTILLSAAAATALFVRC